MTERQTPDPATDEALAVAEADAAREAAAEAKRKVITPKARTSGKTSSRAGAARSTPAKSGATKPAGLKPLVFTDAVRSCSCSAQSCS